MDYDQAFKKLLLGVFYWAVISGIYGVIKITILHYRSDGSPVYADSWKGKLRAYACCIGIVLFISYSMSRSLGTHVEGADPRWGGGEVVQDYEVSEKEKKQDFLNRIVFLLPVTLFGIYKAYKLPLPPVSEN